MDYSKGLCVSHPGSHWCQGLANADVNQLHELLSDELLWFLTDYSKDLCGFQPGSHWHQVLIQMQNKP